MLARRAGVELTASDDAVAVVRELQQQGKLVALVSDSALAAPAFAACDLAIGLTPSSLGASPPVSTCWRPTSGRSPPSWKRGHTVM